MSGALTHRSVDRALAARRAASAAEVERLVEAAFALIRDSGRLEPPVGAIVRAAGLSNQAFYRHFRSKDELLVTVLDEGIRRLAVYLDHRMQQAASPLSRVREWLAGVCEQALNADAAAATRPFALSRARLSELFPEEVAGSERLLSAMLRDAIAEAADRGELPGADPERDAEILYGLAMGWLQTKLAQPGEIRREDAEHLIAFALHGLQREAD